MSILFIHPSHTCGSLTGSMTTVSNEKCVKCSSYARKDQNLIIQKQLTDNRPFHSRPSFQSFGKTRQCLLWKNHKGFAQFALLRKTHIDPTQDCLGRIPHASRVFSVLSARAHSVNRYQRSENEANFVCHSSSQQPSCFFHNFLPRQITLSRSRSCGRSLRPQHRSRRFNQ